MNIAICEDEKNQLDQISSYVEEWAKENNVKANIDCFSNGDSFLFNMENSINYDIIFLDINMGKVSGIDVSNIIREKDKDVSIVFITGTTKYALYGYNVNAMQYLLKPLNKERLFECLNEVYENNLSLDKNNFILIESSSKVFKLDSLSIIYCAMFYPDVHIYTTNTKLIIKMKFADLENLLSDKNFIKPHRSYLVNLRYIYMIDNNYIILDNDDKIPISRLKIKEINRKFVEYFTK